MPRLEQTPLDAGLFFVRTGLLVQTRRIFYEDKEPQRHGDRDLRGFVVVSQVPLSPGQERGRE
jgi:hypothetical protein